MSGNQRSPYQSGQSPTMHFNSYSPNDPKSRQTQYHSPSVPSQSSVSYNSNNTLPPLNTTAGTFYDPTERSETTPNWSNSRYSRQSSQASQGVSFSDSLSQKKKPNCDMNETKVLQRESYGYRDGSVDLGHTRSGRTSLDANASSAFPLQSPTSISRATERNSVSETRAPMDPKTFGHSPVSVQVLTFHLIFRV